MGGDFGIVRNSEEKFEGNPIDFRAASAFNDYISKCDLMDLPFVGSSFTWKKSGERKWQKT